MVDFTFNIISFLSLLFEKAVFLIVNALWASKKRSKESRDKACFKL